MWAAVIQEAYVQGVSTRSVDELVCAMGMEEISRARSRGCAPRWTCRCGTFLAPPIASDWRCLWPDATCVEACGAGCIVPVAVIIAVGVNARAGVKSLAWRSTVRLAA